MSDIEARVEDGVGRILLNRPQAINALSSQMIDDLTRVLTEWAEDPGVHEVLVEGAGRGFCAGADVRQMRQMIVSGSADPVDFLAREYRLDRLVATYPKPYSARMQGIVMGGGMGISVHGSHRVVTPTTTMAMPETIIGLWPDVGMTYHLSRTPGELGTYMALTGLTITGLQAVRGGLADLMVGYDHPEPEDTWMDDIFAGDDITAIMDRLEYSDLPQARETLTALTSRCPLSVVITLHALRRAATMTLDEVFAQDLRLGAFFTGYPDFVEGVRAQLVDKDRTPTWTHAHISDVTQEEVRAAFGD